MSSEETKKDGLLEKYQLVLVDDEEKKREISAEIKLFELAERLWKNKKLWYKLFAGFITMAIIVILLSPTKFTVSTALIPQSEDSSSGNVESLVKQYGGLLGLGGNIDLGSDNVITPTLYPSIVKSIPFQLKLLNSEYYFSLSDSTMQLYDYLEEEASSSVLANTLKYTIGLPMLMMNALDEEEEYALPIGNSQDTVVYLTKQQFFIMEQLREQIWIEVSPETGIVYLALEFTDPNAVTELANSVIDLLTEYAIAYKTRKVTNDLEFAAEQMNLAKGRFDKAQEDLANYQDSNKGVLTAKARARERALQADFDLTYNLYNLFSQQVEQAKIKVQEQTPIFTILDPIQKPFEKSSPRRALIMVVFSFLSVASYVMIQLIGYFNEKNIKLF